MSNRNKIAVVLTVVCFGLLIPGITLPVFQLAADLKVNTQFANVDVRVLDSSRSILGTVQDLWEDNRIVVAVMIFMFSIVIPLVKGIMLLYGIFSSEKQVKSTVQKTLQAIGKWSMADVFVVALSLVFLATTGEGQMADQQLNLMGMMIPIKTGMVMNPEFGPGFFWFLGYCILSLATLHVADL